MCSPSRPTFALGQPTPDAETFVSFEGLLQAFEADDAVLANHLRLRFPASAIAARFGVVGSEEKPGASAAIGRQHPDVVVDSYRSHLRVNASAPLEVPMDLLRTSRDDPADRMEHTCPHRAHPRPRRGPALRERLD